MDDSICIGDYVIFKTLKPNDGWLCFEGIFGSDCCITSDSNMFDNCIWQVFAKNQYSSVHEYEDTFYRCFNQASMVVTADPGDDYETLKRKIIKGFDARTNDLLNQLHRAAVNEIKLNEKLMAIKIGRQIAFGDVIQLKHVKSGRFLTVSSKELARFEKENMQVTVTERGENMSYMSISPRHKIEKEGQKIINNSEIQIRVAERPDEYIHVAKNFKKSTGGEINCSLESTIWVMSVYQKHNLLKSGLILAGNIISLQDPDVLASLSYKDSPDIEAHNRICLTSNFNSIKAIEGFDNEVESLWIIDKANFEIGGAIFFSDLITLRNLCTGLFIGAEEGRLVGVSTREKAAKFRVSSQLKDPKIGAQDYLELQSGQGLILSLENCFIQYTSKSKEESKTSIVLYIECSNSNKKNALQLIASIDVHKRIGSDLYIGAEALDKLRRFHNDAKRLVPTNGFEPTNDVVMSIGVSLHSLFLFLDNVYSYFTVFKSDKSDSYDKYDEFLNVYTPTNVIKRRQIIFQLQRAIDILLDIIDFTTTKVLDKVKIRNRMSTRSLKHQSSEKRPDEMAKELDDVLTARGMSTGRKGLEKDKPTNALGYISGLVSGIESSTPGKRASFKLDESTLPLANRGDTSNSMFSPNSARNALAGSPLINRRGQSSRNLTGSKDELPSRNLMGSGADDDDFSLSNGLQTQRSVSDDVSDNCLRVLLAILSNNSSTRIYVSSRMEILIKQVPKHNLAVLCLKELLREDEVLNSVINQEIIDMFLGLLLNHRMNSEYMKLLNKTCVAGFKGIDSTQRLVTGSLFRHLDFNEMFFSKAEQNLEEFSKYKLVLIQFTSNSNHLTQCEWVGVTDGLYCPMNEDLALESVMSFELIMEGLPQIFVSWTESDVFPEFNMQNLFGYTGMLPLEYLCGASEVESEESTNLDGSESKKSQSKYRQLNARKSNTSLSLQNQVGNKSELKKQVCDYLISQLYLLSDLCLDRNYVSINLIENAITYDALLAILKYDNIPDNVKAPACRLIRCLYIDREPQTKVKYPRLLRSSNSVKGNNGNYDSYDTKRVDSLYSFGLLQIIVSEYIHKSLSKSFDEYSCEMTKTIDMLFEFGYYSNDKQIADIMGPLIGCLDKHVRREVSDKSKHGKHSSANSSISIFADMSQVISTGGETANESSWQARYLLFSENIPYLVIILTVVLLAVSVALVQMYVNNPGDPSSYKKFDYSISVFFLCELTIRMYCYLWVNHDILPYFFKDLFNFLDLFLVLLDITLLSLGAQNSLINSGRFVKLFRVIRLLRLLRLVRAAKLLRKMSDRNRSRTFWILPSRFLEATNEEIQTKINILSIVSQVYDRIHDRKLEHLIKIFILWCDEESLGKSVDPVELYNRFPNHTDNAESLPSNFDDILLDIMMYSDTNLCTEALQLLMIHKSAKQIMLKLSHQVQIIHSSKMESISLQVTDYLNEIQKLGEMYEIWCGLNKSEHEESASRFLKLVENIIDLIKKPNDDRSLDIRTEYLVDEEVQKILFNLDFVSVANTCLNTFYSGGGYKNDRVIYIMCRLILLFCWYVKNSHQNQLSALVSIEWLLDRINDAPRLRTSSLVREILKGNRDVTKQFPRHHIAEFAKRIVRIGHKPEFLDIFLGLVENSHQSDGSTNAISVENEVVKFLTGRDFKHHILQWCCSPGTPGFTQRKEAMEGLSSNKDEILNEYELPEPLHYHVSLLTTLSNCNLGPKLKAMYNIDDLFPALIDPSTIFLVRIALGNVALECIKSDSEHLQCSESVWNFIQYVNDNLIVIAKYTLLPVIKKASSTAVTRILHGRWFDVIFNLLYNFFLFFDLNNFNPDNISNDEMNIRITNMSQSMILALMNSLHENMVHFLDILGVFIGREMLDLIILTTETIAFASGRGKNPTKAIKTREELDTRTKTHGNKNHMRRHSLSHMDIQQLHYRRQFSYFVDKIYASESVSDEAVDLFENLPSQYDPSIVSDIRLEPLLKKLAAYLASHITHVGNLKNFAIETVDIALWLLVTFRHILEKYIPWRIDSGILVKSTSSNLAAQEKFRITFSENNIVALCLDFLAVGITNDISSEALRFLTVILSKDGGCGYVQDVIHKHLLENDSSTFFEFIKETIQNILTWAEKIVENKTVYKDRKTRNIPPSMIIFNFLQLLCEGKNIGIRDFFREQGSNTKMFDIFGHLSDLLDFLSRYYENPLCTFVSIQVLKTCQKFMAGPCTGNQERFIIHTELLVSLNRFIRLSKPRDIILEESWNYDIEKLKETTISTLHASIEGQSKHSVVFEKVSTTVEFNLFSMMLLPTEHDILNKSNMEENNSFQLSKVQAEYLVFMHSLGPNFIRILPPLAINIAEKEVRSIEILWKGEVHNVSFHIPAMVDDISKKSQSSILEDNYDDDGITLEVKLMQFMDKSRTLFKEAEHQRKLSQFGVANFINDSARYYITLLMFLNAVVMNLLILLFYGTRDYDDDIHFHRSLASSGTGPKILTDYIYMSPFIDSIIKGLNWLQVLMVFCVLLIYYTGTMPVYFSRHLEKGSNYFDSLLRTLGDPLPVWYIGYLCISVYALENHRLWLSVLLLDWITLDSTTRDVLRAVQHPARQLGATLIIILVLLNIFSGVTFYFYRHDLVEMSVTDMWSSFKLNLAYGIRGEYGVSHEMKNSLGHRVVFDMLFYFIILAILRHIFFAVIVDTFGKLREIKLEREHHSHNSCFICGVEKQDIDKLSTYVDSTNVFNHHKTTVHDPFLYLYFMIFLWQRNLEDDSGVQMYVRECISKGDTSWFPVGTYSRGVGNHSGKEMYDEEDHLNINEGGFNETPRIKSKNQINKEISDKVIQIEKQLQVFFVAPENTNKNDSAKAVTSPNNLVNASPTNRPGSRIRTQSGGYELDLLDDNNSEKGRNPGAKLKDELGGIVEALNKLQKDIVDLKAKTSLGGTGVPNQRNSNVIGKSDASSSQNRWRSESNESIASAYSGSAGVENSQLVEEERSKYNSKISELETQLRLEKEKEKKRLEDLETQLNLKLAKEQKQVEENLRLADKEKQLQQKLAEAEATILETNLKLENIAKVRPRGKYKSPRNDAFQGPDNAALIDTDFDQFVEGREGDRRYGVSGLSASGKFATAAGDGTENSVENKGLNNMWTAFEDFKQSRASPLGTASAYGASNLRSRPRSAFLTSTVSVNFNSEDTNNGSMLYRGSPDPQSGYFIEKKEAQENHEPQAPNDEGGIVGPSLNIVGNLRLSRSAKK